MQGSTKMNFSLIQRTKLNSILLVTTLKLNCKVKGPNQSVGEVLIIKCPFPSASQATDYPPPDLSIRPELINCLKLHITPSWISPYHPRVSQGTRAFPACVNS